MWVNSLTDGAVVLHTDLHVLGEDGADVGGLLRGPQDLARGPRQVVMLLSALGHELEVIE